jgi:hypothetical protein
VCEPDLHNEIYPSSDGEKLPWLPGTQFAETMGVSAQDVSELIEALCGLWEEEMAREIDEQMGRASSDCWQWRSAMKTLYGRRRLFIQMENILCEMGVRMPRAENEAKQALIGASHRLATWLQGSIRAGKGRKDLSWLPTLWSDGEGAACREVATVAPDVTFVQ